MNAYGMLAVVIIKTKAESLLPLEGLDMSGCKNITSVDKTIKDGIISGTKSSILVKAFRHKLLSK